MEITGLTAQSTPETLARLKDKMDSIPVDECRRAPAGWQPDDEETTLASSFELEGPATYHRGQTSRLIFHPASDGWHFKRTDQPEQFPIPVTAANVLSSRRNILLGTGAPSNHIRMSEHIIALRLGLGLDNLLIETPNGDPPLFDIGSRPLVEAIRRAGLLHCTGKPLTYYTVNQPIFLAGPQDSFLLFEPAEDGSRNLTLDVAVDFATCIGRQRILFDVTPDIFSYGADARTNCSAKEMFLLQTIGRLLPAYHGYGYTRRNILVAGKDNYKTEPALIHNGKCLEPVWHRACLDLLAALSLCPQGRLAGRLTSYKAGHSLDCRFMALMGIGNHWRRLN